VHFACLVTGLRTLTPMVEPAGNFFIRLMCGWPPLARVFFGKSIGRVRSCVRPFGAVSYDRWPEVCLLGIELLQFGPNGSHVLNGRLHDCTIANSTWLAR
jgi:hypothetical protein